MTPAKHSKCNGCGISERFYRQLDKDGYCERCVLERRRGANMTPDVDQPGRPWVHRRTRKV